MSVALPAFQLASEMGPSPSREAELEELCHRQAARLEEMQDLLESPNLPQKPPAAPITKPDEKDAQIRALDERVKEQVKQIDELLNITKEQSEQMGLLRDGIVRLQNEVASCLQSQGRQAEDLARGLQRIRALENPEKDSETNNKRAAKIKEYLAENGTPGKFLDKRTMKLIEGRAVRFELLRSYLEIDKWQLNRALQSLLKMYPGEYCKKKLNKTTWILVERPKL
jgi:small-conductance mechanosensitive channel